MDSIVTTLVRRPDGTEALLLRAASVEVIEGPDKGKTHRVQKMRAVIGTGDECDLRLTDPTVSRLHAEIRAEDNGYRLCDLGSTNGTTVAGLRIAEALVTSPIALKVGSSVLQLRPTDTQVELPLSARTSFGQLVGQSVQMRQVFAVLERVAASDTTVLLEGDSGTGKELAAQAIHDHSPRAAKPFVVVDCGAIAPNLIESELFGHERGAFTGASEARVGAFEQADGGTLFLDEIGELSLELQPKLLRFLERRQLKRVGAASHKEVDVRVIAATNRKLEAEVERGAFRQDVFYRLSVVRIEMPPLRQRPQDVLLMAHSFAQQLGLDSHVVIDASLESLLMSFHWPGNVRQLRHVVEQLALMPELAQQTLAQDAAAELLPTLGTISQLDFHEARRRWQDLFERRYLALRLEQAGGVVSKAAASVGLPRQTYYRLLRRHGIQGDADS